jgi:LAS superfamily LD-carboxypeptidase LdcB
MSARQGILNPEMVRVVSTKNVVKQNADVHMNLQSEAAEHFEKLVEAFYEEFEDALPVSSCFRSREEQIKLRKQAQKPMYMYKVSCL